MSTAVVAEFGRGHPLWLPHRSPSTQLRRDDLTVMTQMRANFAADVPWWVAFGRVAGRIQSFLESRRESSGYRVGFKVDIVSFASRAGERAKRLVRRLFSLLESVASTVRLKFDPRHEGDAALVVLPLGTGPEVLPGLLKALVETLDADNKRYEDVRDRMRLRTAVSMGQCSFDADIGYSGDLLVELARLNDSEVLRNAVIEHESSDVVALVSDRLFEDAKRMAEWTPRWARLIDVKCKEYARPAWLWVGELERAC